MAIEYGSQMKKDQQGQDITDAEGKPVHVWGYINSRTGEIFKTKRQALRKAQNDRLRGKGFHDPESTAAQLSRAARRPRRYSQR